MTLNRRERIVRTMRKALSVLGQWPRSALIVVLIGALATSACGADDGGAPQTASAAGEPSPTLAVSSPAAGLEADLPEGVTAAISVGSPHGLAFASGSIWVANHRDESVTRLDPVTNTVEATIAASDQPAQVVAGFGAVWVVSYSSSSGIVTRIDPVTNEAQEFATRGQTCSLIEQGFGAIWVNHCEDKEIVKIDPTSGKVVGRISANGDPRAGFGSLWVADWMGNSIARVEPASEKVVARIRAGAAPGFGTDVVAFGSVWAISSEDDEVIRIDPTTNRVVGRISVDGHPSSLTVTRRGVYVPLTSGYTTRAVVRIDPARDKVVAELPLEEVGIATGIEFAAGSLWLTSMDDEAIYRIDPF